MNEKYPLPEGWRWVGLGEVCEVVLGSTPRTEDPSNWNGDILWATPADMGKLVSFTIEDTEKRISEKGFKSCSTKLLPAGSVLLTTRAPIGHLAINLKPICTNQGFKSFIPSSQIHNWFLFFALKYFIPDLQLMGRGQTFTEISKEQVENFIIPLPPLAVQKRITSKLQELMQEIEHARTACEKQLEAAKALPSAYLRKIFEPTEAKKWGRKRLDEVCEFNPRRRNFHRPTDALTSFIPMDVIDEKTGTVLKQEVVPYSKVVKGYTYFEEGDVLFAKITPCMQNGKHVIAKNLIDGIGFGTTEFHVLRPKSEVLAEWIHFFIRRPSFLQEATTYFTGAVGQQRVPEEFLANYTIPLASVEEQRRITAELKEKVTQAEKLRVSIEKQLETINALPQVILRKAFKGEL